jgi:hypothetical protein
MPNKSLARPEMRTLVDVLFVVLVASLSFAPLVHARGWDGYDSGTFVYRDETCYLRYSDETYGTDKPRIFLLEGWPIQDPIDLVELSDYQSFVNGLNLYRDFESHGRLTGGGLTVSYRSNHGSLRLTKSIRVTQEGVVVTYESDQPIELRLTLWRWYFSSVDGRDYRGVQLPLKVEPKDTIHFEFVDGGQTYRGVVKLSGEPLNVEVCRDFSGLNKIVIDYVGSHLSIRIALDEASRSSFKIAKDFLYPLMSTAFGLVYLGFRRYAFVVKVRPDRTRR